MGNTFKENDEILYKRLNTLTASQLVSFILYHKELYYLVGAAQISDAAYDALEARLEEIDPGNPVLQMVGYGHLESHKGGQSE